MKTSLTGKLTVQLIFVINCSKEEVVLKLQSYFDRTLRSWDSNVRFSGLLVGDYDFEIRSKWEMTFYRKPYKRTAYISGHISPAPDGTARIYLTQRRKKLLSWFMIIPLLLLSGLSFSGLFVYHDRNIVAAGVAGFIFFVASYVFAFYNLSRWTVSDLVKELKLRRIGDAVPSIS